MILYYVSLLVTLPFSYTVVPPVAAILILLTAIGKVPAAPRVAWQLAELPLVLLVLPVLVFLTRPAVPLAPAPASANAGSAAPLRLVDYNVHSTITFDGWLDPEGTARVLEAEHPDVVTLQEISRGWVIAGSLDIAEWLSRRLQMPYVFAPGHDYQFGNIILTRFPVTESSFTRLPLQNVPMGRALVKAKVDLGQGVVLSVINTHLSAYAATADRIPQVERLLQVWDRTPRSLIAGDMNAHPGDADIALYLQAGLISAEDVTGNASLLTFSSAEPVERIDWVFGTPDIRFTDFKTIATRASDHLPLSVGFIMR